MSQPDRPIYLDCAATTPTDPRVRDVVLHYMDVEFGNAGSRTHIYGQEAAKGVKKAREQIAAVADAKPEEVIFTSGATEANNLAILGLAEYGEKTGKKHIISSQIEHKAVLKPLQYLESQGFEISLVAPTQEGRISSERIAKLLRKDTLLVSLMHVNNETGIIQPIDTVSELLLDHDAVFHVDAAQSFGKELKQIANERIDLLSASAHKINGPKGIGCLILRRKRHAHKKLKGIFHGGTQERNLRAGTLPVPLIAGFGESASLALAEHSHRAVMVKEIYDNFLSILKNVNATVHGDPEHNLKTIVNFRIENIDSEVIILALRDVAAISNGSACTSNSIQPSHVIASMFLNTEIAHSSCRASWSYMTGPIPFHRIEEVLKTIS